MEYVLMTKEGLLEAHQAIYSKQRSISKIYKCKHKLISLKNNLKEKIKNQSKEELKKNNKNLIINFMRNLRLNKINLNLKIIITLKIIQLN